METTTPPHIGTAKAYASGVYFPETKKAAGR